MEIARNAARNLRAYGGLAFADKINSELVYMQRRRFPMEIDLGGVTWVYIGSGIDRKVYRHKTLVLKFPADSNDANSVEFCVYKRVLGTPVARKFAASLCLMDEYLGGPVLLARYVEGRFSASYHASLTFSRRHLDTPLLNLGMQTADIHEGNVKGGKVIDYGRFYLVKPPA